MLLRALLVVVIVLAVELPAAAQTPEPAPKAEPAQVDRPATKRLRKKHAKGEKRERRARRARRVAADRALVVRNAPAHDPADGDDVPPPETAAPVVVGTPGDYKGVRPGKVALPPNPPKATGHPLLTWSGFMMTESGSRVFLQFTQPVQYTVTEGAKEVVVTVKGARIHKRNNGRVINTRYFAHTPVAKVQAKQHGKDVRVTILLRKAAKPEQKLEAGEQGYQFLMLDFPSTGEAAASQPAE